MGWRYRSHYFGKIFGLQHCSLFRKNIGPARDSFATIRMVNRAPLNATFPRTSPPAMKLHILTPAESAHSMLFLGDVRFSSDSDRVGSRMPPPGRRAPTIRAAAPTPSLGQPVPMEEDDSVSSHPGPAERPGGRIMADAPPRQRPRPDSRTERRLDWEDGAARKRFRFVPLGISNSTGPDHYASTPRDIKRTSSPYSRMAHL